MLTILRQSRAAVSRGLSRFSQQLMLMLCISFVGAALPASPARSRRTLAQSRPVGQAVQGCDFAAQPRGCFSQPVQLGGQCDLPGRRSPCSGRNYHPVAERQKLHAERSDCGRTTCCIRPHASGRVLHRTGTTGGVTYGACRAIFRAVLGLLMTLAIPASLAAFALAGMKLRNEGGINYQASGGLSQVAVLGRPSSHAAVSELMAGVRRPAWGCSNGPRRPLYALHKWDQQGCK